MCVSERPKPEKPPEGSSSPSTQLVVVFTVGLLLVLNCFGCYLALRWRRRRDQTGSRTRLSKPSIHHSVLLLWADPPPSPRPPPPPPAISPFPAQKHLWIMRCHFPFGPSLRPFAFVSRLFIKAIASKFSSIIFNLVFSCTPSSSISLPVSSYLLCAPQPSFIFHSQPSSALLV